MQSSCNRSTIFIQLNQNHLMQQRNQKQHHSTFSTNILAALDKTEDIPLTISTAIKKHQSFLPRTSVQTNTHYNTITENKTNFNKEHDNGNESNIDNIGHRYLNQNSNATDYLEKNSTHLHRNVNNNNTIASMNRCRWHNNQSDDKTLQCTNNSSFNTMQPPANHNFSHTSIRKQKEQQQQHRQNQINNNFILSNKKHTINVYDANNDQNNGNHLSRFYH